MATLVLAAVGTAIGSTFGGAILGLSGAAIGGFIGSTIGTVIDSRLMAGRMPTQRVEGARLETLRVTSSTEGAIIPQVFGRMRVGGNIIWATDFREVRRKSSSGGGGKGGGGGPKVETTEYLYFASFAVALCEGPIRAVGRIWADGQPMDMTGVTWRLYRGTETQNADPLIASRMGADRTPAYRGTAYVVFEELPLNAYGNRLPQLTFEVFRPLADADTAEGLTRAVTIIPASGEFIYATERIQKRVGGTYVQAPAPGSGGGGGGTVDPLPPGSIFPTDPRFGTIPGGSGGTAEPSDPPEEPPAGFPPGFIGIGGQSGWVGGTLTDENMNAIEGEADILVSLDRLQALVPAIESATLVVSWFGNDLRVGNCQLRPGVETRDKVTTPRNWRVNGISRGGAWLVSQDAQGRPVYGGTPADFAVVQAIQEMKARGLRVTFYPFILMDVPAGNTLPNPYSNNAAQAGQPVFPWRGRITCSPAAGFAGTVDKTSAAATQVSNFFGSATPGQFTVSGTNVTFTGPADEWSLRRMTLHYAHLCAAAGGVDAFIIATEMRGLTQIRSSGTNYPAVTQLRNLASACRTILGSGTKISYAADWSEYFGHQPGDGTGDVFFHLDPLWSDSSIDFIGIDNYMPLSDWRDGFEHADAQAGWPAIYDRGYLQANIAGGEGFDWFYASDSARAAQQRTPISDGAAGKPWVFRYKDLRAWWENQHRNRPGGVESGSVTSWVPQSKPVWFTELGCPAIDRGTNQPNVFVDPKSSESFVPFFSRGWRDDAIQRAYLEATYLFWGSAANNPLSSVYGGRMVNVAECAAWTWDARPYPWFPALSNIWADGANWRLGHWLTGRLGAVSLAALVRHLCARAGLASNRIDVSGLWGAVEGYVINSLQSPRASITALSEHFGFDGIESGGVIRFVMRGRAAVAELGPDDLVAPSSQGGEPFELTRGQETELPQALKWQIARADEDYDLTIVEAQRITVEASRIASEAFPLAVSPEEAERRCRRSLMEMWVGRETVQFRLPPSRLALDPSDVIRLQNDGRSVEFRVVGAADAESRGIEAIRQDRAVYDLPPGDPRPARVRAARVLTAPDIVILDVPQLRADQPEHQPLIAGFANPWPGPLAIRRSPGTSNFQTVGFIEDIGALGATLTPFFAGPLGRFDLANRLEIRLDAGSIERVDDLTLFGGANALAIEAAPGEWEILQAGVADLIGEGNYRLSRLLRGQRGTEGAMRNPVPVGARVVLLDSAVTTLPVALGELQQPWNWRIGPQSLAVSDNRNTAFTFAARGLGLRPFSPVHVPQPWRFGRVPGDLTLRWVRRSRVLDADGFEQVEVPLGEASEAYEVEIRAGAVVRRVLTSTTPSVVYTSAQQIADWGALLAPGDTLAIRIFQLSARLGRGAPASVTLFF